MENTFHKPPRQTLVWAILQTERKKQCEVEGDLLRNTHGTHLRYIQLFVLLLIDDHIKANTRFKVIFGHDSPAVHS